MTGSDSTPGYANNPDGAISNKAAWEPKFFDEVVKAWYGTPNVPTPTEVEEIEVLYQMFKCVRAFHRLHQLSWPRGIDYFAHMLDARFIANYQQRHNRVSKDPEREAWIFEIWKDELLAKQARNPCGTPEDLAERFAREQARENENTDRRDIEPSTSAPESNSSRTERTDTEQDENDRSNSISPAAAKEVSTGRQEEEPTQTVTGGHDTSIDGPAETRSSDAAVNENTSSTPLTKDTQVTRGDRATSEQDLLVSALPEPNVNDTPPSHSSRHREPSTPPLRLPSPPPRPTTPPPPPSTPLPPPSPPPPPPTTPPPPPSPPPPPPPPSSPPPRTSAHPQQASTPPPEQSAYENRRDWHTAQMTWAEEHSTDNRAENVRNDAKLGLEKVTNRAVGRANRKRKAREVKEAMGEISNKRRQDDEVGARSGRDTESRRNSYRPDPDRAYPVDRYRPRR